MLGLTGKKDSRYTMMIVIRLVKQLNNLIYRLKID